MGRSSLSATSGRYPCCFALVLDALRACIASTADCKLPDTHCELRTADYSSTVRFKSDTRGRSHRWRSVIPRSMEKSVCAHARKQFSEPKRFGGLIWRIDVTAAPRSARCEISDCTETVLRKPERKNAKCEAGRIQAERSRCYRAGVIACAASSDDARHATHVNRVWRNRRSSARPSHRDARAFFVRRSP
ncbi:hypothetical protein HDG33_003408 [Paraburkholderia sp. Cpub6]|nr:hypothetical protein [Paraburkholderia sp. Cpub6]